MSESISFTLAQNALDYLLLAGEQAKVGSTRMIKHSLATLADGVELLLKSRLELKDWCFVFKDVDQASRKRYLSGDFQSVTFEQSVKRLQELCDVEISNTNMAVINELRQLRNRIRHFGVITERALAMSLLAKTFLFANSFVTEHLSDIHAKLEYEIVELRKMLGDFDEFVKLKMKEIASKIEEANTIIQCPFCLQEALSLGEGISQCLFCGYKAEGESAASDWINTFCGYGSLKDSLIDPVVFQCPDCESESCVNVRYITTREKCYVCFSCGQSSDYEHCMRCNNLCEEDSIGSMCKNCREYIIDSWD